MTDSNETSNMERNNTEGHEFEEEIETNDLGELIGSNHNSPPSLHLYVVHKQRLFIDLLLLSANTLVSGRL